MKRPVEVHVRQLVISGFSQAEAARIAEGVQQELAKIFADSGDELTSHHRGGIVRASCSVPVAPGVASIVARTVRGERMP
jgi:hypothetical protein